MPTVEQLRELFNETSHIRETVDGVSLIHFKSKKNDAVLTLPEAGYYDGEVFKSSYTYYLSNSLYFTYSSSGGINVTANSCYIFTPNESKSAGSKSRQFGMPIRPVYVGAK